MIPTNRQIHTRLQVARPDGTTWVDVTDYLTAVDVELGSVSELGTGTGADIGVRSLSFTLSNEGSNTYGWDPADSMGSTADSLGNVEDPLGLTTDDVMGWLILLLGDPEWERQSFAPRDKTSTWNRFNGEWVPLLWPYREVALQVAITSPGATPTNWITPFEGFLGDAITTHTSGVSVDCRDRSKLLQDAYIDVPKTYEGPISAEDLIQAIINDYVDDPPTLYCPVPSGITFDEMKVEYVSVWDAVQTVAGQMGWFLGYRWNGTEYALTFIEPPRNKTVADFHFDWMDDIYQETLEIGDSEIRNALTITYRDQITGERETLRYTDYPELRNDRSISEYRRRVMQIEEADTSLIDTQAKALAFGEKCIWDLSELSVTDRISLPFMPGLDVFSTFTIDNPIVSSTLDFFAVQSIRHSLRWGEDARFRTEVVATGRVVGAKSKWLDMETRPGQPGKPVDPERIPPDSLPPDRLPDYSIGADKFVESVKPVLLVNRRPVLPDPRFPPNTIIYVFPEEQLYRNDGENWVPLVSMNLEDLEGKLQSNQIALEAITEDLIAAEAITKTKVADGAIDTPKLAAGAVTAGKIAARTITAYEIATGAITANEIAARTITAAEIATGAITANKIAANAITAGKIAAGAISADKINAGEISFDKLDIANAKVAASAIGDYSVVQVATEQDDWNVVSFPISASEVGLQIDHSVLGIMINGAIDFYGGFGTDLSFVNQLKDSWPPKLILPHYSSGFTFSVGYDSLAIGKINETDRSFEIVVKRVGGSATRFNLAFRRFSLSYY